MRVVTLATGTMLREMPRKYWKNMPETALVKELVAGARARETAMVAKARTGDQEDLARQPFVGPAGQMFDKAIGAAKAVG